MLILSRHKNERVVIGGIVEVVVVEIRGDKVRLGFNAPREIDVHRAEVYEAIERDKRAEAEGRRSEKEGANHRVTEDSEKGCVR